jgi:hypothetical protein
VEVAIEEYDRAIAHYLWPPRFVGVEQPYWENTGPQPPPDPAVLAEIVTTVELTGGISVRVFRDGMVAFSLGDATPRWDEGALPTNGTFHNWLEKGVRLANAHLACLAAVIKSPLMVPSNVATLWSILQVDFESGKFRGATEYTTGGTRVALWSARQGGNLDDWRFFRGRPLVTTEQIEQSLQLLDSLLGRPDETTALLRAEMLFRATSALVHRDLTGALMNAWTASEALLGDLFSRYLQEQCGCESAQDFLGNTHDFMERGRKAWLTGTDVTVRHTMEFLSLLGVLPLRPYLAARHCSTARNNWVHKGKEPSPETAWLAVWTLGELLESVEGVSLQVTPE